MGGLCKEGGAWSLYKWPFDLWAQASANGGKLQKSEEQVQGAIDAKLFILRWFYRFFRVFEKFHSCDVDILPLLHRNRCFGMWIMYINKKTFKSLTLNYFVFRGTQEGIDTNSTTDRKKVMTESLLCVFQRKKNSRSKNKWNGFSLKYFFFFKCMKFEKKSKCLS